MKSIRLLGWMLLGTSLLQACSSSLKFVPSTVVPAATGTVQTKQDKNKNYVIDVKLRNLAEPGNLTPAKKTYVVWMESKGNPTQKLGQLLPRSKELKADLSATVTSKPTQVYLTAEDDAQVQQATGPVILSTNDR
ncbi:hypothetical protein ACFQ4C_21270 [Larkinella insperata]|uniref:Lipoprotein n=1 Tax=Larkinella insperata TaxID=332158 RepID=A0ABW3QHS6_9BACT